MKARPCRELAVEYLLESTKVWSGGERAGGREVEGGRERVRGVEFRR